MENNIQMKKFTGISIVLSLVFIYFIYAFIPGSSNNRQLDNIDILYINKSLEQEMLSHSIDDIKLNKSDCQDIYQNNDVTVVFPYVTDDDVKLINETLIRLQCIQHVIVTKTAIPKENNFYIYDFKNVWDALNYGVQMVKTKYVHFILPGDYILDNTYNFNSNADMIQLQYIISDNGKYWMEGNNKVEVYDVYQQIPNPSKLLCDKIFKISSLKENAITFSNNDLFSSLIFTYHYMLKSKSIEVVENNIIHTLPKKEMSTKDEIKFSKSFVSYFRDLKRFESDNEYLLERIKLLKEERKEKIFYTHIDYVLPYVTTNDPIWEKEYLKYKNISSAQDDEWATGDLRLRDNGMLKYTLRGIAKHLPWIENLHIIVAYESQIPDWINRDTVKFIFHKDFIPQKHLPTFNSATIEMFLSELPGVNDAFIYGNDDMLCFKDHPPQFFFNGGKPRYSQYIRNYDPNCPGDVTRL